MSQKPPLLFSIELTHVDDGRERAARFFAPIANTKFFPQHNETIEFWTCSFEFRDGRHWKSKSATGDNWLQSVLIAVDAFRRTIPRKEIDKWLTPKGLPSWMVLPIEVPIGWGYEPFKRFYSAMRREELAFQRKIAKRRRESERKRK